MFRALARRGGFLDRHPVVGAPLLAIAFVALTTLGSFALSALVPGLPGYGQELSRSLVLVFVLAALVVALLAALRFWGRAGFVGPARWRDLRLYLLPVAVLVLPLVGGIRPLAPATLGTLAAAYLATALYEESLFRGVILGLLRSTGAWRAVLLSSLLFGLAHLGNIVLRGDPVLIALQALGAATQGVGLAALRLRTNTIWPLLAIHAVHDFVLQLGYLPIPLADAANSIIMLAYGIYLLRRQAVREDLQAEATRMEDRPGRGTAASPTGTAAGEPVTGVR